MQIWALKQKGADTPNWEKPATRKNEPDYKRIEWTEEAEAKGINTKTVDGEFNKDFRRAKATALITFSRFAGRREGNDSHGVDADLTAKPLPRGWRPGHLLCI